VVRDAVNNNCITVLDGEVRDKEAFSIHLNP
jgi:hypothetical protein